MENYSDSEDEVDFKQHNRLLEDLIGLDSKQPVKKPTRTEPTTQISEYNLVKSITGNKDTVRLHKLTQPLKAKASHVEIKKNLKKSDRKTKTLEKPLEKPQADKIRRTVAYEKINEEISRWEPVVTGHRGSTYLSFPLNYNTKVEINSKENLDWTVKSDLDKAIEKMEKESGIMEEIYEIEPEPEAPLTLKEMMERRKELAKLRRFQSYRELKARMQNKIKSKKYRRVLRKEKVKEQMKEFEMLQKNNPEEALKKLDEIERTRAEERASLRHKSTGKWARNQQIRAKYDKESRQVLAEQLAISKELTRKKNVESSESEDEKLDEKEEGENRFDGDLEFNFWINRNKQDLNKGNDTNGVCVDVTQKYVEIQKGISNINNDNKNKDHKIKDDKNKDTEMKPPKVTTVKRKKSVGVQIEDVKKFKKEKIELQGMSGEWKVDDDFVDNLANKLEDKIKNKAEKKSKKIKKNLEPTRNFNKKSEEKSTLNKKKEKVDLTIKKQIKRPIINEKLIEINKNEDITSNNEKLKSLKDILDSKETPKNSTETNKYLKSNGNPVNLNTDSPDLFSTNDNEENVDMRGIIAEAFEDEDLLQDFVKDKKEDINKDTPNDLDLFLPGWGSWGGTNIKNIKKNKRFIVKLPKNLPRKDKNKGDLIINERTSKAIKPHLVSEVPFPFKSVKDYEASVRAPIGNTFVPETAFRRFISPAVTTKLGTVIDPVDEEVLMRKMKKMEKFIEVKK